MSLSSQQQQAQLEQHYQLMDAITQTLAKYISESNPFILFNGLLDKLLALTQSEYGFIGEVFYAIMVNLIFKVTPPLILLGAQKLASFIKKQPIKA